MNYLVRSFAIFILITAQRCRVTDSTQEVHIEWMERWRLVSFEKWLTMKESMRTFWELLKWKKVTDRDWTLFAVSASDSYPSSSCLSVLNGWSWRIFCHASVNVNFAFSNIFLWKHKSFVLAFSYSQLLLLVYVCLFAIKTLPLMDFVKQNRIFHFMNFFLLLQMEHEIYFWNGFSGFSDYFGIYWQSVLVASSHTWRFYH